MANQMGFSPGAARIYHLWNRSSPGSGRYQPTRAQQIHSHLRGRWTMWRKKRSRSVRFGAAALGALAIGAFAVGALAIGRLAIGSLAVYKSSLKSLKIDELTVGRLRVSQLEVTDGLTLPGRYLCPTAAPGGGA